MTSLQKGDFVEMDGLVAVVVATDDDPNVPEEHIGLWFGDPAAKRISQGGAGVAAAEISIVPVEYCSPVSEVHFTH